MSPVSPVAAPEAFVDASVASTPSEADLAECAPTEANLAESVPIEAHLAESARVARWLEANPQFFEVHAQLLSEIRIQQPPGARAHGGRTISLVERQVHDLRDKVRLLESRMAELIRIAQENDAFGARLQQLTRDLLGEPEAARLPQRLIDGLVGAFGVPQVAIRFYGVPAGLRVPAGLQAIGEPFTGVVSADLRRRVDQMSGPYCGPNAMAEPAGWLPDGGSDTASVALLALRPNANAASFGLVVMGSPDAARFQANLGTDFLERLAGIAGASLSRLLPQPTPGEAAA